MSVTQVKPLVLVGPSAVGKGTITAKLFEKYGQYLGKKISTTTRAPRAGEINGQDYHFVTPEEFLLAEKQGAFVETANVHGKHYGTSYAAVIAAGSGNRVPILELDVQGVCSIKRITPDIVNDTLNNNNITEFDITTLLQPHMDSILIWIAPPTPETLLERLKQRGTESDEQIQKRLETAQFELAFFNKFSKIFDKVIINDDLNRALNEMDEYLHLMYPTVFIRQEQQPQPQQQEQQQ